MTSISIIILSIAVIALAIQLGSLRNRIEQLEAESKEHKSGILNLCQCINIINADLSSLINFNKRK